MGKKKALGRGLGALIDTSPEVETEGSSIIGEVPLDQIEANPYQPRTVFNEEALEELAGSIREVGVIQPVTLRQVSEERYQLIAGERRFRASKLAGLTKIPAYIRLAEDEAIMEMALIENIQREDLDAIEIALSYQGLMDECKYTQDQLATRVGKKRATVANYLRLLRLPAEIQMGVRDKKIQMGHARALLGLNDPTVQLQVYAQILAEDLAVRKVEAIIRDWDKPGNSSKKKIIDSSEEYAELKNYLTEFFGANVGFERKNSGKGKITIHFTADDELEQIIARLDGYKN